MKLIDLSVEQYLDNAQTKEPNPGGGSVAAYVGGLGAALSIMVLNLSYGKDDYEALPQSEKDKLEELKVDFDKKIEKLKFYVDEDSKSFNKVLEGFRMPRDTEEEKAARAQVIQDGYMYALEVPLTTARLCAEMLDDLEPFVQYGDVGAITDVGCGILFLSSAIEAALFNVTINLQSIKDRDFAAKTEKEVAKLIEGAHEKRDEYLKMTYARLED